MSEVPTSRARKGARPCLLVTGMVALLAAPLASLAGTDSTNPTPAKASSFAPHHSKSHVYGTPIAKPILHKRKKPKKPAAPGAAPEPIK